MGYNCRKAFMLQMICKCKGLILLAVNYGDLFDFQIRFFEKTTHLVLIAMCGKTVQFFDMGF